MPGIGVWHSPQLRFERASVLRYRRLHVLHWPASAASRMGRPEKMHPGKETPHEPQRVSKSLMLALHWWHE